jgi:aminoglycoside phosphotransferase family enzyme/predicted kinase
MSGSTVVPAAAVSAACAAVEIRETHISWVFIAGDSAYKLKKPIVLPFVDYGTRERRQHMCQEEMRLNRRLAPSIYRGVLGLVPDSAGLRLAAADHPDAVEHVVWMRRFREDRSLASMVARGAVGEADIEAVGARLAEFHAAAAIVSGVDQVAAIRAASKETFTALSELCPPRLRPMVLAGRRFTEAFLREHGSEIRARADAGLARDGHGDLRAEHVLIDGGVEVIDCLEFDPALREIDVGADLSFLFMDLERLGERALARSLVKAYVAHGGDPGRDALVAFHAAQRAWVRAKVTFIRATQLGADRERARDDACGLIELARRLSWRARQPLLLVTCGLSGVGKSTLARELARISGAGVVSADAVRKRLAGLAEGESGRAEHYSPAFSRRTYAELGRLADREMRESGVAIIDATFRAQADRDAFATSLGSTGAKTRLVECVTPPELRIERAASRAVAAVDISDATAEVAAAQRFDPLPASSDDRHLRVRMDRAVALVVSDVEAWLDAGSRDVGVSPRGSSHTRARVGTSTRCTKSTRRFE